MSVEPASGPHVTPPVGWALGAQIAEGGTAVVYSVRRDSGASAIMKWGRWRDRDIHARFAFEADVLRSPSARRSRPRTSSTAIATAGRHT